MRLQQRAARSFGLRSLPWALLWAASLPASSAVFEHRSGQAYRVAAADTLDGDRYVLSAMTIAIDGTLDGDLVGFSRTIDVAGTLTGDAILAAESIRIDGSVGDSLRAAANNLTIDGDIDGDVVAFAASIVVGPQAHIRGDLIAFAQSVSVSGKIDGSIQLTCGQFTLNGSVAKNVNATGEEVALGPAAKIGGDFTYVARERIDVPAGSVGGAVSYQPRSDGEEAEETTSASPVKAVLWWFWKCAAALVVGFLLLAAFRRAGARVAGVVGRDPLGSLGIGFVTAVVVPVASVLACLLIVTIPLAFLALLLYVVVLYVAKLPVAAWLGTQILRRLGATRAGTGTGLLVGIPLLYLAFEVPYLGTLLWFVTLFIGLGAILMGSRSPRGERPSEAAPPGAAPAPA